MVVVMARKTPSPSVAAPYGQWVDDCFVTANEIMTVKPNGHLEIRGDGWGPTLRSRRVDNEGSDRVRVCKFDSEAEARRMAELVSIALYAPRDADGSILK